MGTLAFAKAPDGFYNAGNRRVRVFDVTFTGSYVTGGETLTPASVGLRRVEQVRGAIGDATGATGALLQRYNATTGKLQIYTSAGAAPASLAEKTAAAYNTATVGRLEFVGQ